MFIGDPPPPSVTVRIVWSCDCRPRKPRRARTTTQGEWPEVPHCGTCNEPMTIQSMDQISTRRGFDVDDALDELT
jgi:hypothetical protein